MAARKSITATLVFFSFLPTLASAQRLTSTNTYTAAPQNSFPGESEKTITAGICGIDGGTLKLMHWRASTDAPSPAMSLIFYKLPNLSSGSFPFFPLDKNDSLSPAPQSGVINFSPPLAVPIDAKRFRDFAISGTVSEAIFSPIVLRGSNDCFYMQPYMPGPGPSDLWLDVEWTEGP